GCDTFYVFQCDTAACFKLDIAFPQGNSFSHLSGRHVVEKNDVYALDVGESARLLQIISFHFNADVWLLLTKLTNSIGKTGKPSKSRQVIVLYEHHVVQAKTMIHAAACDHCCLFQRPHSGRGLACIQNLGWMVSNGINKLARKGRDAAETLQKIQCDPLRLQNRPRQTAHFDNKAASDNLVSIPVKNLD